MLFYLIFSAHMHAGMHAWTWPNIWLEHGWNSLHRFFIIALNCSRSTVKIGVEL